MTEAEHKSETELTKDTPYLSLKGELLGVYCDDFGRKFIVFYNNKIQNFIKYQKLTIA